MNIINFHPLKIRVFPVPFFFTMGIHHDPAIGDHLFYQFIIRHIPVDNGLAQRPDEQIMIFSSRDHQHAIKFTVISSWKCIQISPFMIPEKDEIDIRFFRCGQNFAKHTAAIMRPVAVGVHQAAVFMKIGQFRRLLILLLQFD